jgi:metallo-beta-lactamase family protein
MGVSAFDIFFNSNWHKISVSDCVAISKMFTMITDYRDTIEAINDKPKVVIAASGMVTGGRVLNYLEEFISHPETTVII